MHFPTDVHDNLKEAYGPITDATWARAKGWATFFGVVLADSGADGGDPVWAATGRAILERVCR